MPTTHWAEMFEAAGLRSPVDLVAANDAMRAELDEMARQNRPIPPDLREAAAALEAELFEAQFDNLPV